MLEKDFNGIVTKSLNNSLNGYGFKISDTFVPGSQNFSRSKAPCDGFGFFTSQNGSSYPVYFESKNLTQVKAFSLTRLENHQIEFLLNVYKTLGDNALALFLINVDFGRGDKRVFIWKNRDLLAINERKLKSLNILKKEFENRRNFIKISKGLLDFDEILQLPADDYTI